MGKEHNLWVGGGEITQLACVYICRKEMSHNRHRTLSYLEDGGQHQRVLMSPLVCSQRSPKHASLPLPHHSKRNGSRRRIYTFATSGEHNSEFTTTIIYGELIIHTICNTTGKRGLLGHLVTWEKTAMSQYTFSKVSRQFKAQARIPVMKCCYKCWMLPVSYVEFNIVVHFNIS